MDRKLQMIELYNAGQTYASIATLFGLSRQRVHQIIKSPEYRKYIKKDWDYKHGWKTATTMTGRDYVREIVRVRDNHTCQNCGKKWKPPKRRLDVHHLNGLCGKKSQGYDRLADMHTLITLCHKCHFNHHEFSKKLSVTS